MKRIGCMLLFLGSFCLIATCKDMRGNDAHVVSPCPEAPSVIMPFTPSPVPTDTPAPSPTPTETPVPTPTPMPGNDVCDAYYADTVFVGDSLTVGFKRYVNQLRSETGACLDGAAFVAGEGLSIRSLKSDQRLAGRMTLLYNETRVSVTEGIILSGKHQAVILLGTNDFGGLRLPATLENYCELLDRITDMCPDVAITLVAVPPVTKRFCIDRHVNIEKWNSLNPVLEELCKERGMGFISFSAAVSDAEGYLAPACSSDNLIHLSTEGFAAWLSALRLHAAGRLYDEQLLFPS